MKQEHQTDKQVNAFTKGEWILSNDGFEVIQGIDGFTIAKCGFYSRGISDNEAQANAILIASAPALKAENEKLSNDVRALREALEGITRAFKKVSEEHCPDDSICEWLGEAHEALLKTKQD